MYGLAPVNDRLTPANGFELEGDVFLLIVGTDAQHTFTIATSAEVLEHGFQIARP